VALETKENQPQKNLMSVNSLKRPKTSQKSLEIKDREIVEV